MKIKGEDFGSISRKQNLRDHPNLYSPNISLISISGIVSSVGLVHTGGNAKYESPLNFLYPSQKNRILLILASLAQYVMNELIEGQSENSVVILLSGYSFVSLRHETMASITDSIS